MFKEERVRFNVTKKLTYENHRTTNAEQSMPEQKNTRAGIANRHDPDEMG